MGKGGPKGRKNTYLLVFVIVVVFVDFSIFFLISLFALCETELYVLL